MLRNGASPDARRLLMETAARALGTGREEFSTKDVLSLFFFFQAEDGIRDYKVTGVQTCALPISKAGLGVMPGMRCVRHLPAGLLWPAPGLSWAKGREGNHSQGARESCTVRNEIGRASCRERV